ncbi:MAG: ABC transporter permease [Dactylosporangium sp.]|nr:ABC transporter permease [Dactylosporangium sp.]NNJ59374.1 ABC transporter permease [Dactylosporangium sp.]
MTALTRKLLRDLRRGPAQLLAVVALVALGVALYGASYDAYRNLDASYNAIFDRYHFADLTIVGGDAPAIATEVATIDGVATVATRTVADTPLRLADGKTLTGRVIGLPTTGQPPINQVEVESGSYLDPSRAGGVLAESHLADQADLSEDSTVEIWVGGTWQPLTVLGTVASPEYLWPAASRQDVLPAPGTFGVLFVPESLARQVLGPEPAEATQTGPNEVTVYYTPAARDDASELDARLAALAQRHGAADVVPRDDQPSNATLALDIKGFEELAIMFPVLFLTAAGLATYVVLTRRVARDRAIIGMMRASGFRRRTVLGHYLTTGLLCGLAGSVIGVLLGIAAAGTVTRLYIEAIGVPLTLVSIRASTVLGGLAFGLVAGALSALAPALAASRVPPAEAMRGVVPSTRGGRGLLARLERWIPATRRLPAAAWFVLRGPTRHPRRTLYTEIGVVLALVLILVSWGMLDTVRATMARQYDQVQRQDAQLVLDRPADAAILDDLAGVPGVAAVEPITERPITLEAGSKTYATALLGLRPDTTMHTFLDPDGGTRPLPATGVLLGTALREDLGVNSGDRVSLRFLDGSPADLTVAGFVDEPLGTFAYVSLDQVRALDATARSTGALVRFDPGTDAEAMRRALTSRPGVVAYEDTEALRRAAEDFMGLFYVFVGVMLLFGGMLAFTVLFATMSVNVAERSVEIATLRASGVSQRRLARLVTAENLLLVTVGILPGLGLGWLATDAYLSAFNTDLMRFATDIRPGTFAWSALAVVVVALLAQLPGLRALGRLDLGTVVRERAG